MVCPPRKCVYFSFRVFVLFGDHNTKTIICHLSGIYQKGHQTGKSVVHLCELCPETR